MITVLISVIALSAIIAFVNAYQAKHLQNTLALRSLLYLFPLMTFIIGGLVFVTLLSANTEVELSHEGAIGLFISSVALSAIGVVLIASRSARQFVQRVVIRSDGIHRRYHADAVVHTLALLLMFFASINTIGNFVLAGGIEGIAIEISSIRASDLLTNLLMYLIFSLLGVGLFTRRDLARSLRRLGIRLVRDDQWLIWLRNGVRYLVIGAFVGFGMFWLQIGMTLIWQLFTPPETLAAQSAASQALFAALGNSLWLGFLVAFTAGVGEELLFRGALQPIFGNVLVSIFFVMLHSQYLLTPASLIIFIISLIFGFLRDHTTTPAAMMAHFVYNFTPFVFIALLNRWGITLEAFIF